MITSELPKPTHIQESLKFEGATQTKERVMRLQ